MSDLEDLKSQLSTLRHEVGTKQNAVYTKRMELKQEESDLDRIRRRAESLARYVHEMDGEERGCTGHKFIAEPSGRGVGFDERCVHCGYFRTLYPVF